jgi:hypothetical protein
MIITKIQGMPAFKKFMKDVQTYHAEGFERGLLLGALVIQRDAVRQTPIDLGPLRASYAGSPRKTGSGFDAVVEVSCGTHYAIYVHENLNANFKAPGTNAKFLERPARQHAEDVKKLVIQEARKP